MMRVYQAAGPEAAQAAAGAGACGMPPGSMPNEMPGSNDPTAPDTPMDDLD